MRALRRTYGWSMIFQTAVSTASFPPQDTARAILFSHFILVSRRLQIKREARQLARDHGTPDNNRSEARYCLLRSCVMILSPSILPQQGGKEHDATRGPALFQDVEYP